MTGTLKILGRLGPVIFVECGPEAHAFVVDAWCKSYEPVALEHLGMGTPEKLAKEVRRAVCSGLYTKVKALLARPATRIICAVSEHDESVVCGFVVSGRWPKADAWVVHYCYVKADMRRLGVAERLLKTDLELTAPGRHAGERWCYSHHTPAGQWFADRFCLGYRPEEATHG